MKSRRTGRNSDKLLPRVRGRYALYHVRDGQWDEQPFAERDNLIMYSWGFLAAQCIGLGDTTYKVNAAYLEYKNVASPSDAITVPSYDRGDGLSYFNSLPSDQDFLRVALAGTPVIDIATGYESYFTSGVDGNRVKFTVQTAGTQGVLGREFSDTVNSKLFGLTLVATPLYPDRTQDVILARGYFDVADQTVKAAGSQLGVRWYITFA